MASRLREVILPGTMSFIVSNLPKMSKTEVTLLIWRYVHFVFQNQLQQKYTRLIFQPHLVLNLTDSDPNRWQRAGTILPTDGMGGCWDAFSCRSFWRKGRFSHTSNADNNKACNFITGCTSGPLMMWIHLFLTAFGSLKTSLNFPKHSYSHLDCSLWDLNLYLEVLFSIST